MDAVPRHFPIKHLVAHCGLAAHFPENSILALLEVAEAGAAIVEFDIQRSADGVPMVIYDASLQRTTATAGAVGNFTASELMALSCGYPVLFGEQFAQIHVPSLLQTVAALAARQDVFVLAEIKDESIQRFGLEACITPVYAALAPIRARTLIISFSQAAVEPAQLAGWPVGWCIDKHDEVSQDIADSLSSELLLTDQLTLHTTQDLWPGPWRWASWEVVDPVRAVELFELGVDYVVTMDCKALLADRNVVVCIRNATTVRQKF